MAASTPHNILDAEQTLQPGQTLGKYEIVRVAGRGGMGVVYAAKDPDIGRTVALKTLLLPDSVPAGKRERLRGLFRQEARTAGNLSHPSIVTIHDVDTADSVDFIVMEFVPGPTLRAELRQGGALSLDRALNLASQVCAALAYGHGQGVVHRDVKPANILLATKDHCKVTDFGIAAVGIEGASGDRPTMGTLGYMAPEQMLRKPADARSDLFSLGVTLAQMLSGQRPFKGMTGEQMLETVHKGSVEMPKGVPPEMEALLAKALAFSPDDRHQTAEELAADLEAVQAAVDAQREGLSARDPAAQKRARLLRNATCVHHPLAPAMDFCAECDKPVCASCVQVEQGRPYCFKCTPRSGLLSGSFVRSNLAFALATALLIVAIVIALLLRR